MIEYSRARRDRLTEIMGKRDFCVAELLALVATDRFIYTDNRDGNCRCM